MIDLDAQATTPPVPEVLAAMRPYLEEVHWNPHSAHRGGRRARAALEAARAEVAALLDAEPAEIVFTSGATEANNLALKGLLAERSGPRQRLVTFATEHACVLETARHLARLGVPVSILPVTREGLPDMDAYQAALAEGDVALVSAMAVNNEVGAIWPIPALARLAHAAGALFHTDAAQAAGKIDCRLSPGGGLAGADLVSLSAHKMHGPKGIGALRVPQGLRLAPLLDGGGQEAGLRSGTQAPALAAGFGAAARLAREELPARLAHARCLMTIALSLLAPVPHRVNGPDPLGPARWPGNLSVRFPGLDSARIIARLPEVALASGAACASGSGKPSHVLAALGLRAEEARATLRLGWHARSTEAEVRDGIGRLVETVRRLAPMAA